VDIKHTCQDAFVADALKKFEVTTGLSLIIVFSLQKQHCARIVLSFISAFLKPNVTALGKTLDLDLSSILFILSTKTA
jgi:hypothetical protein